ncbi:glycosyltransferase family 4 protein [Oryzobacter telluris]|uniref:glycosyltransferase family 4 protein n=1 Tax=Oryzobacter telluris TaxID=3149179 RepID=UPI00370D49C9
MTTVVLAANNGDVGGGEVMLLATARALVDLGVDVEVAGPRADGGVLDQAAALGLPVHDFPGDRRAYMSGLRRWSVDRPDWLWCHGLVPALATSGRRRRIVHLHQAPAPAHRGPARVARLRAEAVVVPSQSMARAVPGAEVLWNWTHPVSLPLSTLRGGPLRIGFIGRLSADKGVHVLAEAVGLLEERHPGRQRLVLAGDSRFVPDDQRDRVRTALAHVEPVTDALGWVERRDFFSAVDLAVFPSTWQEPFGLVLAEAMSSRTPVVVSDAGALPEVVGPDHPWVVAPGDPAALADAIDVVSTAHPSVVEDVVDAAQRRWTESFSPDAGRARVAALAARLGLISPDLGASTS